MKNTYKLLAIVFLSFTMVISSCKKDEQIIEGCTDSSAMNYLSNATSNNGSCIYAYNIAQDTWNLTPDCSDLPVSIPGLSANDMIPTSIEIEGGGGNTLYIDMNGSQVSGNIDNEGNIIVNEQTISIDFSGFPIPVQVSGTGKIETENSGYMDLTYSGEIDIIPNVPIPVPFGITCHIVLAK